MVQARIDPVTKARAAAALSAMGLTVSDAIRLLMIRIAEEQQLPCEVKTPNAATVRAINEIDSGTGATFSSAKALFEDSNCNADDRP